jgi:hypothetical protein
VATAVALVSTVVLVWFSLAQTHVASTITSTLAVLGSITVILGFFQVEPPKFPRISFKVTEWAVYSILGIDIIAALAWGISSYGQAYGAVDVVSKIVLSGNVDMHQNGASATLDVPVTAQRDGIELVFHIADHDPNIGNCAPYAELSVKRSAAGNTAMPLAAVSGRPVRVDLPHGSTSLRLDITLRDTDRMRNCGVDLTVTSAKLANK